MDRITSYDEDVYAWAFEQAEVLRQLARTPRRAPDELDVENIAEEIEGVARTELREAESFLRLLLVHLLKMASAPNALSLGHWRIEAEIFQSSFQSTATATILRKLRRDKIWKLALKQAADQLASGSDALLEGLPSHLPVSAESLAVEDCDLEAAMASILRSAEIRSPA